jgi:hypothetical protein
MLAQLSRTAWVYAGRLEVLDHSIDNFKDTYIRASCVGRTS